MNKQINWEPKKKGKLINNNKNNMNNKNNKNKKNKNKNNNRNKGQILKLDYKHILKYLNQCLI